MQIAFEFAGDLWIKHWRFSFASWNVSDVSLHFVIGKTTVLLYFNQFLCLRFKNSTRRRPSGSTMTRTSCLLKCSWQTASLMLCLKTQWMCSHSFLTRGPKETPSPDGFSAWILARSQFFRHPPGNSSQPIAAQASTNWCANSNPSMPSVPVLPLSLTNCASFPTFTYWNASADCSDDIGTLKNAFWAIQPTNTI